MCMFQKKKSITYINQKNNEKTFITHKSDGQAPQVGVPWRVVPRSWVVPYTQYEYSFELTKNSILSESLYHYPFGRRAKVFVRDTNGQYSFGTGIFSKPTDVVLNTSNKNLFLSRASSMNREIAQKLYRYFMNQFLLGLVNVNEMMVLDSFNTYKKVILKALEICDTDITDIEARKEQIYAPAAILGQVEVKLVDALKFKTFHRNQKDVMFDMDMEESNGTRKLFQILIRLLDVVKNKKSIMMDEFDMGLHTRLADFILDLIHASESSQLLFTSHNTNLIDVKRLRRDQIVFVNKSEQGATEVYSLYDFKDFRENMDAEKGYIQGRFDAVPYVDSSVSSIKQLLDDWSFVCVHSEEYLYWCDLFLFAGIFFAISVYPPIPKNIFVISHCVFLW